MWEWCLRCTCPDWGSQTNCQIHTGWRRLCRSWRRCWTWRSYIFCEVLWKQMCLVQRVESSRNLMRCNEDGTYSRQCPTGSSEWTAPRDWTNQCQTPRWRSEEGFPGWCRHSTVPSKNTRRVWWPHRPVERFDWKCPERKKSNWEKFMTSANLLMISAKDLL